MSGVSEIDRTMMARCRELAAEAKRAGNHGVGSLVAVGEEILAEAGEQTPAGEVAFAHAELLAVQGALQAAGARHLPGATLYSTHEPCLLCSYAIRAARIGRVVVEQAVAAIGGVTSRYPILTADDVGAWGPPPTVKWMAAPSTPAATRRSPPDARGGT